jgi:hypothetical protein
MALFNEPSTLVKVAEYFGDLEKTAHYFDPRMISLKLNPSFVKGFMLYESKPQSYLLTIYCDLSGDSLSKAGYNFSWGITSRSFETNNFVCEEFSLKTGITLRDAPDSLVKIFKSQSTFLNCEQCKGNVMEILKKGR